VLMTVSTEVRSRSRYARMVPVGATARRPGWGRPSVVTGSDVAWGRGISETVRV